MTVEELLKPRYKVIGDYPQCPYQLGVIINPKDPAGHIQYNIDNKHIGDFFIGNYPHLFEKLEWWEERENEDMPVYVKNSADQHCYRLMKYDMKGFTNSDVVVQDIRKVSFHHSLFDLEPITKEQFDRYELNYKS